jgi:predicted Fe-Mo cluster-binding NifX family protein
LSPRIVNSKASFTGKLIIKKITIMKIAVASQNQKTISAHAGKTSRFYIYTINEADNSISEPKLINLDKDDILHNRFHESTNPWAPHPIYDVDIVITGGAGPGFVKRLATQATKVIITPETNPDKAVKQLLAGTLPQQAPEHHHH